jgi:hypothetical protein
LNPLDSALIVENVVAFCHSYLGLLFKVFKANTACFISLVNIYDVRILFIFTLFDFDIFEQTRLKLKNNFSHLFSFYSLHFYLLFGPHVTKVPPVVDNMPTLSVTIALEVFISSATIVTKSHASAKCT